MARNQARSACGIDRDRRSMQTECVRHAPCADRQRVRRVIHALARVPKARHIPLDRPDAHHDACEAPVERAASEIGVVERTIGVLEDQPLLRVHRGSLLH